MMKVLQKFRWVGFLGALSLTCAAHSETQEVVLQPSSGWNLKEANDACTVYRRFGAADRPVLLRLSRSHLGTSSAEVTLSGYPVEGVAPDVPVTVAFVPGAPIDGGLPLSAQNSQFGATIILRTRFGGNSSEIRLPGVETAGAVQRVAISAGDMNVMLETGSMGEALADLDRCVNDLYSGWGVDPTMKGRISKYPKLLDPMAFTADVLKRYPLELARLGKEGRVPFVVIVDANGAVIGCHVVQSYADKGFDEPVCDAVRKARFSPALDSDKKPMTWVLDSAAIFKL
ncbi:energy transducer TonB [Novosphingobium sp. BL-8A]|uniref:energy transducer TonB n=1 Tax=Novosphingobium sp. BL-8A TaxID=3127639 RepID=UPI0037577D89